VVCLLDDVDDVWGGWQRYLTSVGSEGSSTTSVENMSVSSGTSSGADFGSTSLTSQDESTYVGWTA
jgi:hypothetical protein